MDRRGWLASAGALVVTARAALADKAQAAPSPGARPGLYDYLSVDLAAAPGVSPSRGLDEHLKATGRAAIQRAGGEILGVFTPQLGWDSTRAAILVGWSAPAAGRDAAIARLLATPTIRSSQRDRLTPTVRPETVRAPQSGGIYVHRWFVVEPAALPEFVALSVEGWRDFESRFETNIFGLFEAARTREDVKQGVARLLLLTRYRDHAVWEASRNPTTAAMAAFARRQRLTRKSWGASTLLTPG